MSYYTRNYVFFKIFYWKYILNQQKNPQNEDLVENLKWQPDKGQVRTIWNFKYRYHRLIKVFMGGDDLYRANL